MSSIHEVAKHAGVSTATVSRTFSTPDLLSQETRERVLQVAERLNYRPRRRAPKSNPPVSRPTEMSDCIGFLFFASDNDSDRINQFYSSVLVGAQEEAARLEMHLIVRSLPRFETPTEMPRMSREQAVAGMLLVGAAPEGVLGVFRGQIGPAVLVDNQAACGQDMVISDGFEGMLEATRYLVELGHRKIAFVMNEVTAPSFNDRMRGYLAAHFDAGLVPDDRWILKRQRSDSIDEPLAQMLSAPDRPTAIVSANDRTAFDVMKCCRDNGLSIPHDISLVGFDDVAFSVHTYPPLTTVNVDKQLIGRLAVRQLQWRIEEATRSTPPDPPVRIMVPARLVRRESCSPPRTQ